MALDDVRRRSYLAGVAATLTGLAGCQGNGDGDATESTAATDAVSQTDQSSATQQEGVPTHTHSGEDDGGAALTPERINGTVYAAQMPGDDLSAKVRAAIDAIPNGGTVVVTPNPEGIPWTWRDTLSINLRETGGISLLFRGMTMIEYTGDSWAIETTYRPAEYGQLAQGTFLQLRGGNWRATGNPDGWLKMVDTNFSEIRPQRVIDFTNEEKTATGIRVEIQEVFSESNVFSGHLATVDVGMDFVPSDTPGIAGGEAAASFQGNIVQNVKVLNASKYAFRWRDGSQCQAMTVMNPDAFAGTFNAADEVVLYYLGGDFDGAVFVGPKTEDAGSTNEENDVNDVAYRLPDALGTPPLVVAPENGARVDTLVDRDDKYKTLPTLGVWDDGRRMRAGVHDLGRRAEEPRFMHGAVAFPPERAGQEVSQILEPEGKVVYFDGSSGQPAGLYRSDPENSQWVKVEDNSVTFST